MSNSKKYLYDILDIKPKKIDNDLPSVASNSKSSAIIDGSNSSSINSITQSDNAVNTEYAQTTQKDTSNYISPISDLQGATEFVKKATIKDVDRLRKMLAEAEQSTNRIDLQFFAEEVKKKIEYLTKSQRYQKNKVDAWVNKLQKTYGLEKTQASEYINEYIEAYKNDGDILEARETLLNKLNTNGTLGEYASIELSNDIDNLNRELDTVKRYETDRAKNEADKEKNKNYYKLNKETVSKLYHDGFMEAVTVEQTAVFEAAELFARCEGTLPAPESSHAIRVAIDEALKCKETGEKKVIVFGLTGTGYFDLTAYKAHREQTMTDYIPTDADLQKGFDSLPKVK